MTTLLRWLFGALLLASLIGSRAARAQPPPQSRRASASLTVPFSFGDSTRNHAPTKGTRGQFSLREQALLAAVDYVRGAASEELPSVPADSIDVDASSLLDDKRNQPSSAVTVGLAETLHAAISWTSNYACGRGLSPHQALFARGQCGVKRFKFYIEAAALSIDSDEATVMVHVFRRPSGVQRIDYIGYTIALHHMPRGWGAPRVVSITET
jgi:hypothetical protein